MVLFSLLPFHNSFARFLDSVSKSLLLKEFSSQIARDVYKLVDKAVTDISSVPVYVRHQDNVFQFKVPAASALPLCDINFSILFRRIEPGLIVQVLNALLFEHPVLLVSDVIENLSPSCEVRCT